MNIVTTTGFYGTGSSAITDLLMEYDCIKIKSDYEIRIAHDPYGIRNLEFNLIENPNRHNSSFALKKFIDYVDFLSNPILGKKYQKYFEGQFKRIATSYIDSLFEFSYSGSWHYDLIDRGLFVFFCSRLYNKIIKFLRLCLGIHDERNYSLLVSKPKAYGTICNEDEFLLHTRDFFEQLAKSINPEGMESVLMDQLVPPSNIGVYERYFNSIKIIVVDRDPRDIFLLEKLVWKGPVVPCNDVELFCKWFLWTRRQYENTNKGSSLFIQFEDLIYDYDETIGNIEKYLGISPENHKNKFKKFNPSFSIKNTKLWEKFPEYKDEISFIEHKLKQYCYQRK